MQLMRYADPAAYDAHVRDFLAANEAEHCLMLGLCAMLAAEPDRPGEPPYLAVVQQGEQIVAAAMRTPPQNVVLSLVAPDALGPAVELLARDLYAAYGTALPGVIAAAPVSAAFAERWQTVAERPHHLRLHERIYKLERVAAPSGVPGRMRAAAAAERELLARWAVAFEREALSNHPVDDTLEWVDLRISGPADRRGLWVWEDGGDVVSMVGYGGQTPHGMRIGPVYTPPEQRGHGYASALTAGVSQMLLDGGRQFVFLFTDLGNPTSNHIYQTIGYRPVCDVDVYEFAS